MDNQSLQRKFEVYMVAKNQRTPNFDAYSYFWLYTVFDDVWWLLSVLLCSTFRHIRHPYSHITHANLPASATITRTWPYLASSHASRSSWAKPWTESLCHNSLQEHAPTCGAPAEFATLLLRKCFWIQWIFLDPANCFRNSELHLGFILKETRQTPPDSFPI